SGIRQLLRACNRSGWRHGCRARRGVRATLNAARASALWFLSGPDRKTRAGFFGAVRKSSERRQRIDSPVRQAQGPEPVEGLALIATFQPTVYARKNAAPRTCTVAAAPSYFA